MSLRFKTIVGVALIEAVLLVILVTTVLNYMRLTNEEALENYIGTITQLFVSTTKDAVLSYDLASLDTFVEEILTNDGVLYARIFDANNNLLASGGAPENLNRAFKADLNFNEVTDKVYDTSTPIMVDGVPYGRIEMGVSTEGIESAVLEARKLAASIASLEMFLVALFSFALGTYLTRQLKTLRNAARRIEAGDFTETIVVKAKDEIGEVAYSFNKMVASLNKAKEEASNYHDEILSLNKSLENRVEQRTKKILEQNQQLQKALTQLKQTQKQLVHSEKMASIGQLAAGVAHEINNPVAFIKSNLGSLNTYVRTYSEIIDKQQSILNQLEQKDRKDLLTQIEELKTFSEEKDLDFVNEDIDTLLQESIDGTSRVEEIVKGLRVYSRKSDEVMEKYDINVCIQDTLKLLNNQLKYKCDVNLKLSPIPLCLCNPSKITQVFTNLMVNAIQAMEEHGQLTIESQHVEASPSSIVIKITDTGKGIPEENLGKLFDPFFTTKPVGQGTGIGLSICQGIIEDHRGRIEVTSTLGQGTSFSIHLPLD